jgi:hypothetical protein
LEPDPVQVLSFLLGALLLVSFILMPLGQLPDELILGAQQLEVAALQILLELVRKLDVLLLLVNVGETPRLLEVELKDDKIFLHRIVHHVDLALFVPDSLLDADQVGHGRLDGLDQVVGQIGDEGVVPLERGHQRDERQHDYSKVGSVLLDNYDLLLEQQGSHQQQNLVNILNFVEQAREVEGLRLELAIVFVDVPVVKFRYIPLPVVLVRALQRNCMD